MTNRGFFEIGLYHPKHECNAGTLWRSAHIFGAAGIFTIGRRFQRQNSDTTKAHEHIPVRHYLDFAAFKENVPFGAMIVGIEMLRDNVYRNSHPLDHFYHPRKGIYILGAEDHGIPPKILSQCNLVVEIPTQSDISLNVAVAGSIVMFHRTTQLRCPKYRIVTENPMAVAT